MMVAHDTQMVSRRTEGRETGERHRIYQVISHDGGITSKAHRTRMERVVQHIAHHPRCRPHEESSKFMFSISFRRRPDFSGAPRANWRSSIHSRFCFQLWYMPSIPLQGPNVLDAFFPSPSPRAVRAQNDKTPDKPFRNLHSISGL